MHTTEYRVRRWPGFDGPAVSPVPQGPLLFEEVRAVLKGHIHWRYEWCYDLSALWVMQAQVTWALNSVFYLLFSGTFGGGKTTALDVLAALSGAVNASDITTAALVTELDNAPGRALVLDEFDVHRGRDRDSALAAICRNGYTRGKQYIRNDPKSHTNYDCETFGAKAIGFRGAIDDALEDRGFPLPCGKYLGPDGFRLVQNNDGLELGDLPDRLQRWGGEGIRNREHFRKLFKSPEWATPVERVVGVEYIGANRESQLASVALQVCRMCCIDLTDSLQAALSLRRESAAANTPVMLEEASETLEELIRSQSTLTKEVEVYVVRQKDYAAALNLKRADRGERALTSSQLAALRNDLGIEPTWLSHPQNKTIWNIPVKAWADRRGVANLPNSPNPAVSDGGVSQVRQVRQGAHEDDAWVINGEAVE